MAQEDEGRSIEQDIERYRAMLERDPSSSVFAPLAESLRRGGFLDEAMTVCVEGLQKYPNHVSGKVALGRIYYDKGMLQEAKKEFEEVVKISPDNILASRILKEINDKTGEEKKSQEIKDSQKVEGLEPGVKDENTIPMTPDSQLSLDSSLTTHDHLKEEPLQVYAEVEDKKQEISAASKTEPEFSKGVYTVTMAELLEKQGHLDEALKVYEEILKEDAKSEVVKESINRLKSLHKKPLPKEKDAKDDERVKQLADWASKFKRGTQK